MNTRPKMLNALEFEQRLEEFGDNQLELLKFVARQYYETSNLCPIHDKSIKNLEKQNKKLFGIVGGAGAILGTAITAMVDYFLRRS